MKEFYLNTDNISDWKETVCKGNKIYLSGTVFTARDAAHKLIVEAIKNGVDLPFNIKNAVIYFAGPTPTPKNKAIGSCGPTTSSRMDSYSPVLYDLGLACTIGKGPRNQEVVNSIIKNKSLYLCAIGGAGALSSRCITSCEVIAYDNLGCESVKKLTFDNFPLIVGIDTKGESLF